ncbi:hypothetical protein HK100_007592, partial [Physocladia obscura]
MSGQGQKNCEFVNFDPQQQKNLFLFYLWLGNMADVDMKGQIGVDGVEGETERGADGAAEGGKGLQWTVASLLSLREASDVYTLGFVLATLGLNAALWRAPRVHVWQWALLVQATLSVSTIVHNAMHVPLFHAHRPRANAGFNLLLSLAFGHPVATFVSAHNRSHHRFAQSAKDHMRTTQMRYTHNALNYALFFATVAPSLQHADFRFMRLMRGQGQAQLPLQAQLPPPHNFPRALWSAFRAQCLLIAAAHLVALTVNPRRWLLLWVSPRLAASIFITNMNMLQHDGCPAPVLTPLVGRNKSQPNSLLAPIHIANINTARNFTGSITNFLFFNNGYHSIHHIRPTLHWSKLPAAHNELVKPIIHPNLDQENMASYFFKTFIYPANRITYDGKPYDPNLVEITPEVENEEWFPYPDKFSNIRTEHHL